MGRGAGNLCTELLTQFINENIEDKYELIPILEIMDEHIMPIYSRRTWGYSAPYYIAAVNGCHPNYASYLMNRQSLCIRDISAIIKLIPSEKRHLFDKALISELYTSYQAHTIDDSAAVAEIAELCRDKKVLILAPGQSLITCRDKIEEYIRSCSPVVFSINHIPDIYPCDRVFVSNLKRFKGIDDALSSVKGGIICTSNIAAGDSICAVNYGSYLNDNEIISDNSGLMLINVLKKAGVSSLALAGYDGFGYNGVKNYFDEKLISADDMEKREMMNKAIGDYFTKIRRSMDIEFITPSRYNGDNNE